MIPFQKLVSKSCSLKKKSNLYKKNSYIYDIKNIFGQHSIWKPPIVLPIAILGSVLRVGRILGKIMRWFLWNLSIIFAIYCGHTLEAPFGRISVVKLKEISDRISGQNFRQTYKRISEGKKMYELFEKFQFSNILSYFLYLYIILLARPLAEIFWVSQQKFRRSSRDLRMISAEILGEVLWSWRYDDINMHTADNLWKIHTWEYFWN